MIHRIRNDDTSGAINGELDWLGAHCSSEYSVFADYQSARITVDVVGKESCASWAQYIGAEAIELLRQDGLCTSGSAALPENAVKWNKAKNKVGKRKTVCGPLAGIGYSSDDVFLNVGKDYPSPKRFTIVLWDVGYILEIPAGSTVCVRGKITTYNGVAQIQVRSWDRVDVYG